MTSVLWLVSVTLAGAVTFDVRERDLRGYHDGHVDPQLPYPLDVLTPTLRKNKNVIPQAALRNIRSISCLEARQQDPSIECSGDDKVSMEHVDFVRQETVPAQVGVGSYPGLQSERCHAHGAYMCDPDARLTEEENVALAAELRSFPEEASVMCGELDAKLSGGKAKRTPFYLGLAIVGTWPQNEGDRATLQKFGDVVMAQWGLLPAYNGVNVLGNSTAPQVASTMPNCPNSALLLVLADRGQAFLSAPSCEFLCHRRGGLEVEATFEATVQRGLGLKAAVSAAIAEVGFALNRTSPLSLEEPLDTRDRRSERELKRWQAKVWRTDEGWVFAQRFVIGAAALITLCIVAGFVVVSVSPAAPTSRKI